MPRPVYILCCESFTEDKSTNLVSIFTILERVEIIGRPRVAGAEPAELVTRSLASIVTKAIAVWMKEPGDERHEFEADWSLTLPDGTKQASGPPRPFRFAKDKHLQRFTLTMGGFPLPSRSGVMTIESRVRRKGSKRWKTQNYPLVVDLIIPQPDDAQSAGTPGERGGLAKGRREPTKSQRK